tara:strand:- start:1566 stop:1817 length:252 start_codon:yes stop_codon:yes gene_type:complete
MNRQEKIEELYNEYIQVYSEKSHEEITRMVSEQITRMYVKKKLIKIGNQVSELESLNVLYSMELIRDVLYEMIKEEVAEQGNG